MSLFSGLFGGQQAAASGLFSSNSKYAAPANLLSAAAPVAAPPAGAAAAAEASGGSKKRRKEAAAQQNTSSGPAAVAENEGQQKKKQRKEHRQQGSAAAQPAKQPQKEGRGAAGNDAAAGTGGAGVPASKVVLGLDKSGKPPKRSSKAASEDGGSSTPAAAAAAEGNKKGKEKEKKKAAAKQQPAEEQDERLPRTVFVGNLPSTVKRKALVRLFSSCGAVESVRLRSLPLKQQPDSKIPRRGAIASGAIDADHSAHAYVVFAEEAAVQAALAFNMREFEGHHLRVDRAAPKAAKGAVLFDPSRSLFVGNLPLDAEDEEVIRHFGADAVEAVRIVRDAKSGAGKGVCFVLFRSQEACLAAMKQRKGSELRGRELRITRVKRQQDGKAAWQQGRDSKGGGKPAGKGKGSSSSSNRPVAGKRKASGKRPSVAARKLKQQQKRDRKA